ncbi:MAG TPA: hypothetical protein VGJ14_15990 [Sporichthyaceae bacterium]|jgi:hypothetical protein
MNGKRDTSDAGTAEEGVRLDPRQAALLVEQAKRQARRQFEPYPPWLLVIRAVLALIAYGALWLSVRGQHPYAHPPAALIPVGVGIGLINVIATVAVGKRATSGISGRSRFRSGQIGLAAFVWLAVFVAMAPMADAGVSDRIVYGLYPATAPLIVAGVIWAGITAARADWRACVGGLAAAAVGAVAWLAGPAGAWAIVGVGLCLVLLERAAELSWRQHV